MENEIIERVAEALKWVPVRDLQAPGGELDQLRLREAARAAIEAMREPTGEMARALYGDAGPYTKEPAGVPWVNPSDAAMFWGAMIDAALTLPAP